MSRHDHKVWCATWDPTPGMCDCGAPTNYDIGYAAGVRQASALQPTTTPGELATVRHSILPTPREPTAAMFIAGTKALAEAQGSFARHVWYAMHDEWTRSTEANTSTTGDGE